MCIKGTTTTHLRSRWGRVETEEGWIKITILKSQVLGANFLQLKKLGMQTPFGQTAAASNQPYSARSLEPSS